MTQCFVIAIKGKPDQFAFTIQNRRSGITTGDIVAADKTDNQVVSLFVDILAKIPFLKKFDLFLRQVKFIVTGFVFFQYTFGSGDIVIKYSVAGAI